MSKVVYLAGHGRVSPNVATIVPSKITMHWLGHLGDVSNGISYAFLSGNLTAEINTSGPRSEIPEHYLCGERADVDPVTDTKIKNFLDRNVANPLGDNDPYLLYPRGKTNVSLCSIFDFLKKLSPTQEWHLYWTCCRGYIGESNPMTSTFNKKTRAVERLVRDKPEITPVLSAQDHKTENADFTNVRLIARSDRSAIQEGSVAGLNKRQALLAPRQYTDVVEKFLFRV